MNRKYFYVVLLLSLISAGLIFYSLARENTSPPKRYEEATHHKGPFKRYITGVGVVEAGSENISIGLPMQRVIEKVLVTPGIDVHKGDPLMELEKGDLLAELAARKIEYEIAKAEVYKLEQLPRTEDVETALAGVEKVAAELKQARETYAMAAGLDKLGALSHEDIQRRLYQLKVLESEERQAQAALDKVKAGAWEPDIKIARLQADQARVAMEKVQEDINRTVIRSPIDGKVLQVKIQPGEYPPMDTFQTPIMIVGNTEDKRLIVSINQFNAPLFDKDAAAVAYLQGNRKNAYTLEFVRLEPYLTAKQNLTNDIHEKVDTRVLKITYRFKADPVDIYVGQQMDVFIQTKDE